MPNDPTEAESMMDNVQADLAAESRTRIPKEPWPSSPYRQQIVVLVVEHNSNHAELAGWIQHAVGEITAVRRVGVVVGDGRGGSVMDQSDLDNVVSLMRPTNASPTTRRTPVPPRGWTLDPEPDDDGFWTLQDPSGRIHTGSWIDDTWYRIWPAPTAHVHLAGGDGGTACGDWAGVRRHQAITNAAGEVTCPKCIKLADTR
jgi:hypothetical protein